MTSAPNPFDAPATDDAFGPYGAEPEVMTQQVLADRGTRFLSAMVDTLVYVGALIPGFVFLGLEMEEVGWVTLGVCYLAILGYQWYLIATTGQTIAKKLFKIKIVRDDGTDVDFVHGVILRIWTIVGLGFIPFIGNFIGLIDALMIFGDDYKCLHDKIAKTKVISIQY